MDGILSPEEFNDVMVAQYNINQGMIAYNAYVIAHETGTIMLKQAVAELYNSDLTTTPLPVLAARAVAMVSDELNVADLKEKISDRKKYMVEVSMGQRKILSRLRWRLSLLDPKEASKKCNELSAMFTDPSYECKNVISINGYYESALPQRDTQNDNTTTPEAFSTTSSPGTSHETSPARSLDELSETVRRVMERVYGDTSSSESSSSTSSPTDNGIDLNSEPTLATNGSHDVITINDNNRMDARVGRPIKTARRRINKAQTATAKKSKIRKAAQSENTRELQAVTILPAPASEVEEVTEFAMETSVVTGEVDITVSKSEEETVIEYDHEKPYLARVKATDNVEPIHESLAETRQPQTQTNRPEIMHAGVYDKKDFFWFLHLMPTEAAKEYAAKVIERNTAQVNAPRRTRRANAGVNSKYKDHVISHASLRTPNENPSISPDLSLNNPSSSSLPTPPPKKKQPHKKRKVAQRNQKKGGNKRAKMSRK